VSSTEARAGGSEAIQQRLEEDVAREWLDTWPSSSTAAAESEASSGSTAGAAARGLVSSIEV
jgi:hypothetical protein